MYLGRVCYRESRDDILAVALIVNDCVSFYTAAWRMAAWRMHQRISKV